MSFSIGQASIEQIRADFPLLSREVNAQPLAYRTVLPVRRNHK